MRIRESQHLNIVLPVHDQDNEYKDMPPSYQRLKTMVKQFLDQKMRARNFVARKEHRRKAEPKRNQSALKRSSEIAVRGKQMTSAQKETHAVSATMTVNVEKVHARPLPLQCRRRKSMRKTLRKAGHPERSVHRVRCS